MEENDIEDFYNKIAETYDWLFSDRKKIMQDQMEALVPILRKNNVKKILDCACGTGMQSIGLIKEDFQVLSSDLSQGMIDQAISNAMEEGINLETVQADFRELSQKFRGPFDAIVCMGNSLPHLLSDNEIKIALSSMYQLITKKGLVVIEIRNFDELFWTQKRFIPIRVNAEHNNYLVTILYVIDEIKPFARFNVLYILQDRTSKDFKLKVHSADYYPIGNEKLAQLLRDVGFIDIEIKKFGEFIWFIGRK